MTVPSVKVAIEGLRTRLAALSPSSRLLLGSLAVILAMALFLVAQYAGRGPGTPSRLVPLAVSTEATPGARSWLSEHGVEHELKDGQIMVEPEARERVLAALSEQGVGGARLIDFNTLLEEESPFHTQEQSRFLRMAATMGVLERMIGQYKGVRSAKVVIADPQRTTGIGAQFVPPTASVAVTMEQGEMTQDLVDAVAGLVAGAHPGLRVENVTVTDGAANRRRHARRTEDLAAGTNLEQAMRLESVVQRRIEQHLAFIPGVMVAVHAQMVTKEISRREQSYRDPVVGPLSERTSSTATQGPSPSGDVGLRPNVGVSVIQSTRGQSSSTELNESRLDPRFPNETAVIRDPTGYPAKINASINVPRSYIVGLWRLRQGAEGAAPGAAQPAAAAEPDEAALDAIRSAEMERIRRSVEPLIDTDTVDGGRVGTVQVSMFVDALPASAAPPVPQAQAAGLVGSLADAGGGAGLWSMAGLIALGGVALALMIFVAMRAMPRAPAPASVPAAGAAGAAQVAAAAGPVSPGVAAEVVGDAETETPPLEGREVDDEHLRRRQMLQQINDLVTRNPADAASLLRRWMRAAG